jgi:hypothetical protein
MLEEVATLRTLERCFSTAGPQPGTGPSSYKNVIHRAAVSQRLRTTALEPYSDYWPQQLLC